MKRLDAYTDRFMGWLERTLCSARFDRLCTIVLCVLFGWLLGLIQNLAR